jgi:hypothetical protein
MCKILAKLEAFMRRIEPSPECLLCGYLIHSKDGVCEVCGDDPDNVLVRGDKITIACHMCGKLVDGLKGPFSCRCRG